MVWERVASLCGGCGRDCILKDTTGPDKGNAGCEYTGRCVSGIEVLIVQATSRLEKLGTLATFTVTKIKQCYGYFVLL